MRLGILGGSFDPVHLGHLLLAEFCREQCRLDQVWLIPAASPPHKQRQNLTPADQRLEMLRLAIGGHEQLFASDLEIRRGGVSYTVDTLGTLRAEHPNAELFFLMGADSLADFHTWREPQRICQLALPAVVRRHGSTEPQLTELEKYLPPQRVAAARELLVSMPVVEISSREIRRRVAAGLSIRYQTPRAVEKYIESHGLYRDGG